MSKNSNKYIFKYNQEGQLYNYIELNKADKVISYFKIENNTLIRYDKNSDTKQLIKFKQQIILKQKFMAGESFITVFDATTDECVQHKMPEKEKQITLVKNNVSVSDFGKFVVERWKKLKEKDGGKSTKETLTFSKPMYQSVLRLPVAINVKGTRSIGPR